MPILRINVCQTIRNSKLDRRVVPIQKRELLSASTCHSRLSGHLPVIGSFPKSRCRSAWCPQGGSDSGAHFPAFFSESAAQDHIETFDQIRQSRSVFSEIKLALAIWQVCPSLFPSRCRRTSMPLKSRPVDWNSNNKSREMRVRMETPQTESLWQVDRKYSK